ncbi:hypothetical protein [Pseudodesulfovibrio tunisiensis]|uniref:hypothetical protein n=1 Tax=Pseudodesulfovibrio tunisiensis TaxID=463192 RepID=UPI003C77F4C2
MACLDAALSLPNWMALPGCMTRARAGSSGRAQPMRSFHRSRQTSYCFCHPGGHGFSALP